MSEALTKLTERVTSLEYDMKCAGRTMEECDFTIKFDPKKCDESHAGERVSEVDSLSYLGKLANFLDWSAFSDESKSEADEKQKKYARYRHGDAARVRRIMFMKIAKRASAQADGAAGDGGIPF